MTIEIKKYNLEQDYERVNQFLIDIYKPGDTFSNWLQPRWEYMHHHPFVWELELTQFGIFEDSGKIVGVVHPENNPGLCHFQIKPGYEYLKPQMLDYFEETFQGISKSTNRLIRGAFISELDTEMEELAAQRGYERWADFGEPASIIYLDKAIPKIDMLEGFKVQTLAVENDLRKMNRVLWRGFNHEGPPPEDEIPGRELMQSSKNFHTDQTCVVLAPDGNFVAYSGIYFVEELKMAMIEPVATDKDHRRKGFGTAVVYECLRIVQAKGAKFAWVGSDLEFYKSIGFVTKFTEYPWVKVLDNNVG
jgi:GNAT superfamily N-acetyltransferase